MLSFLTNPPTKAYKEATLDFEEALKQAAREKEEGQRKKAEKEREDKARQYQAAVLLEKLGKDVASTCRARYFPFNGIATYEQR